MVPFQVISDTWMVAVVSDSSALMGRTASVRRPSQRSSVPLQTDECHQRKAGVLGAEPGQTTGLLCTCPHPCSESLLEVKGTFLSLSQTPVTTCAQCGLLQNEVGKTSRAAPRFVCPGMESELVIVSSGTRSAARQPLTSSGCRGRGGSSVQAGSKCPVPMAGVVFVTWCLDLKQQFEPTALHLLTG
jgi:hypothetical protein